MKKTFLFVIAVMVSICCNAQLLNGDLDGDGKITMNDVTLLIDKYLNPFYSDDDIESFLTLSSGESTYIDASSVKLSGHIDGLKNLKKGTYSCGYVYSTDPEPTRTNGKYKDAIPDNGNLSVELTNLSNDTQYYYRMMLVTKNNEVLYGKTGSFYMNDVITPGTIIDLGLSVKWASCDLGATTPQEEGTSYAWGEIATKASFSQDNYVHYNKVFNVYYDLGTLISGSPDYDAASATLGDDWHIPSIDEMNELIDCCTWERFTYRNTSGYKVTGPNGNCIFLPSLNYWTGSCSDGLSLYATGTNGKSTRNTYRHLGLAIRPVKGYRFDSVDEFSTKLNVVSLPSGSKVGFYVNSAETPNASNSKYIASRQVEEGIFTLEYTESNTFNFRPVLVLASGEMIYGETRSIRDGHEYIDLGTGILWAKVNLGAKFSDEYGDYFAWGETIGHKDKETKIDWSDYKWCQGSQDTLTKYTTNVDNKMVLDLEDDAAHINWGGNWRTPTKDELKKLIDECSWKRVTSYNGRNVIGYIVYRQNTVFRLLSDPHLFLPVKVDGANGTLYYWSSSLIGNTPQYAYCLYFSGPSDQVGWLSGQRCRRNGVRAVCDK